MEGKDVKGKREVGRGRKVAEGEITKARQ